MATIHPSGTILRIAPNGDGVVRRTPNP
jgi:hypothetical protein